MQFTFPGLGETVTSPVTMEAPPMYEETFNQAPPIIPAPSYEDVMKQQPY